MITLPPAVNSGLIYAKMRENRTDGLSFISKTLARALGVIASISLLCPAASRAQNAYIPNVGNVGLPENGVFSGGSIDSVQLQNGNLHVDIPLLHLPGIGMDTDIHFVYDNQLFSSTLVTYGTTQLNFPWHQLSIGRNGFAQVSGPLDGVLKVGTHQENWWCGDTIIPTGSIPGITWSGTLTHLDYMAFTDSNGTGHSFPISGYENNAQFNQDPCHPGNSLPSVNSYSEDATGSLLSGYKLNRFSWLEKQGK